MNNIIDMTILENSNKINSVNDFIKIVGASGMAEIIENIKCYTDEEVLEEMDEEAYVIEYLRDKCILCIHEDKYECLTIYANLLYRLN